MNLSLNKRRMPGVQPNRTEPLCINTTCISICGKCLPKLGWYRPSSWQACQIALSTGARHVASCRCIEARHSCTEVVLCFDMCEYILYIVYCILYIVYCILYIVCHTLYITYCTLYILYCVQICEDFFCIYIGSLVSCVCPCLWLTIVVFCVAKHLSAMQAERHTARFTSTAGDSGFWSQCGPASASCGTWRSQAGCHHPCSTGF